MPDVVELEIDFQFEAAHKLTRVPADHKCARLHGHYFVCAVQVQGVVDESLGWLLDYADIRAAIDPVRQRLDHHYLNDIEGLENPTSERLARWIWDRLQPQLPLTAVTVSETCNARCTYRGEGGA